MELIGHCNLFVNLLIEIVCQIAWKIVADFIPIIVYSAANFQYFHQL